MDEQQERATEYEHLRDLAALHEQPFTSDVPVLGGLIVWFRTAWNNVSTRWYVRPLAAQQTAFNETIVDKLEADRQNVRTEIRAALEELENVAVTMDNRLVAQDRDQAHTIHDLGELSAQLTALRRAVSDLEARLVRLEGGED